jgi:Spy/CpxP family protein refolding chaperone
MICGDLGHRQKSKMKTTRFYICLAAIFIAVSCGSSKAQTPAQPQRPQNFVPGERFFPMLNRVLTDEQRESLRALAQAQRDQIRPLEEKLMAARRALLDAAVSGKPDDNLIRQNADALAKAESELTVIYVRAISQIKPPLTPEQIGQMKNLQPGAGRFQAAPPEKSPPEKHLDLPPPLPRDTNDLPVVK